MIGIGAIHTCSSISRHLIVSQQYHAVRSSIPKIIRDIDLCDDILDTYTHVKMPATTVADARCSGQFVRPSLSALFPFVGFHLRCWAVVALHSIINIVSEWAILSNTIALWYPYALNSTYTMNNELLALFHCRLLSYVLTANVSAISDTNLYHRHRRCCCRCHRRCCVVWNTCNLIAILFVCSTSSFDFILSK